MMALFLPLLPSFSFVVVQLRNTLEDAIDEGFGASPNSCSSSTPRGGTKPRSSTPPGILHGNDSKNPSKERREKTRPRASYAPVGEAFLKSVAHNNRHASRLRGAERKKERKKESAHLLRPASASQASAGKVASSASACLSP